MPNELKPCPFCGGQAALKRETECVGFGMSDTYYFVQCEVCKASSKRFGRLDADTELERNLNAIFSWNRRTNNDQ